MRSKKSKVTLLVLVAAVVSLVFWGYSALAGAEDTPGGSGDPLGTQS